MLRMLIPQDSIDTIEMDIFQNTAIQWIMPYSHIEETGNVTCFSWNFAPYMKSISELVHEKQFNDDLIQNFLIQYDELKASLLKQMLYPQHLIFSLKCIYYNPKNKIFYWLYIPSEPEKSAFTEDDMARLLLFELIKITPDQNYWSKLSLDKELNLCSLGEKLDKIKVAESKEKFSLKNFFKKNKRKVEEKETLKLSNQKSKQPLLINRSKPTQQFFLQSESITIGQSEDNTIKIFDESLPHYYAIIYQLKGSFFIEPCCQDNPISINDNLVVKSITLNCGDIIQAGKENFVFIE